MDGATEAKPRPARVRVAAGAALDRHRAREARERGLLAIARIAVSRERPAARVDVQFGGDATTRDDAQMDIDRALHRPRRESLLVEGEAVPARQVKTAVLVQGDDPRAARSGGVSLRVADRESPGCGAHREGDGRCGRKQAYETPSSVTVASHECYLLSGRSSWTGGGRVEVLGRAGLQSAAQAHSSNRDQRPTDEMTRKGRTR